MWTNLKRKSDNLESSKEIEGQAGRRKKETRCIKMGWGLVTETGLKVIRSNLGGGPAHNFSVSKQCTKVDLIAMGKHIFFPNQKSTIGHESEFTFDIQLGRGVSMGDDDTVESFFVASKNLYLRLYLACTRLTDLPWLTTDCHNQMPIINDEYDTEMVRENTSNDAVYLYKEIRVKNYTIFDDLINEFCNEFWQDCDYNFVYLNVVVELADGNTVVNEERDTTFKKCLTVFWKEFYARLTKGSRWKVPVLRYDFNEYRWMAVAKILAIGWIKMRYFPILLSPPFISACLDQEPMLDLLEPLLLYLRPNDSKLLTNALENFDSVDKNELAHIFSGINFQIEDELTELNFSNIVQGIAHVIHIQQPRFIVDCWRSELKPVAVEMTRESLQEIYNNLVPTSEKLISILRFDHITTGKHESACGFLKRFMRDSDIESLAKFLQFVTGSDMLTVDVIFISFSDKPGFSKPASTSIDSFEADLIVSTCYDNYEDFKNELNDVLSRV